MSIIVGKFLPGNQEILYTYCSCTLLTCDCHMIPSQGLNVIQTGASKPDDLVKLLSALQASMFFWCKGALASSTEEGDKMKEAAISLLSECECCHCILVRYFYGWYCISESSQYIKSVISSNSQCIQSVIYNMQMWASYLTTVLFC